MKTKLSLAALLFFAFTFTFAAPTPTDNATAPKPDQTYPLTLLPQLDVLYFNQTIDFLLPETSTATIDHVEFTRGTVTMIDKGFRLLVMYTNLPEAADEMRVYVRNTGGVELAYKRKISLMQKLNKNVGYDDDLFKLDDEEIGLSNTFSKEKMLLAKRLQINSQRFNADKIEMKEFDMEINAAGVIKKFHSPTGEITEEMKDAMRGLQIGDFISVRNIVSQYKVNGQKVEMNINYTPRFTIGITG